MTDAPSDRLAERVQELIAKLGTQAAELEAVKAELAKLSTTCETAAAVEPNFKATGPGIGFCARANTNNGMDIGVLGVATNLKNSADGVGVMGFTSGSLDPGSRAGGIGVLGTTEGGIGVRGVNIGADGAGVQGVSPLGGAGVTGTGGPVSAGVIGTGGPVSVLGSGGVIGVEGSGEQIGVLGGALFGRPLDLTNAIAVGVLGNALPNSGEFSASYGGWFDAGPSGTAPLHLEPSDTASPPQVGERGDLYVDSGGRLWFCESAPAGWRQVQLA
jgi:hypothetical protein